MAANTGYDLQTDTHLSKDFNRVLQMCMISCNQASLIVKGTPHYDLLQYYYSAVNSFFINTFFLFEGLNYKDKKYTDALMDNMSNIEKGMKMMKYEPNYRTSQMFDGVLSQISHVHMMIMAGLQKRKMLVRMSEAEPKGIAAIEYWEERQSFKKGNIEYKEAVIDGKSERYI